jgi:hypothetical protein
MRRKERMEGKRRLARSVVSKQKITKQQLQRMEKIK